ncbi:hypothetical protein BJ741DRAFT_597994 [Chytriomyces cf. hyalinus JEL632]|nr:hypothetical protein BJ741DRAFT_597994 [Chytriomyces cf. hyalinus JEL632]
MERRNEPSPILDPAENDAEAKKRLRKEKIKALADLSDESIRHLPMSDVNATISNGTHLIFYGANYCPYTQKYTPLWLEFQKLYDQTPIWQSQFTIHKVQCAEDENFCVDMGVDGYPTVFMFRNGVLMEEMDTDDMSASVHSFIEREAIKPTVAAEQSKSSDAPSDIHTAITASASPPMTSNKLDETLELSFTVMKPEESAIILHPNTSDSPKDFLILYSIFATLLVAGVGLLFFRYIQNRRAAYRRVRPKWITNPGNGSTSISARIRKRDTFNSSKEWGRVITFYCSPRVYFFGISSLRREIVCRQTLEILSHPIMCTTRSTPPYCAVVSVQTIRAPDFV